MKKLPNEVVMFQPPLSGVELARKRTQGIRRELARRESIGFDDPRETLAISCYLQGVNDTAETMFRRGIEIFTLTGDEFSNYGDGI